MRKSTVKATNRCVMVMRILIDSKRAEQGNTYSALTNVYIGVLSDDFAAVAFREELCYHSLPKKQNSESYFILITIPKKSRAKNNTNLDLSSWFVLFLSGAEDGT